MFFYIYSLLTSGAISTLIVFWLLSVLLQNVCQDGSLIFYCRPHLPTAWEQIKTWNLAPDVLCEQYNVCSYPSSLRQTRVTCRLSKTWTYWRCFVYPPPVNQNIDLFSHGKQIQCIFPRKYWDVCCISNHFWRTFEDLKNASTFFKLLNWNWINDHFMSNFYKSPMSHIRFGAVQLGQCGRSEQSFPLAERLHSSLVGSRGATGQRLGADCQLPWCFWSVCGSKVWL